MIRGGLIFLSLALLATGGQAAECDDAAADQATLNQCAAAEMQAAQAELDRLYLDLEARLLGEAAKLELMHAARDAGAAFREAECAFAASGVEGGSMQPAIHAGCMADMLEARAAQLRTYLDCPEGDLSCPVPWLQ